MGRRRLAANLFDSWNCESLDAARLTEVVYYSSAGFLFLQARELEHVPVQHGSFVPAQDWCGFGQAGPEIWPSLTHTQNGHRLTAYGDFALIQRDSRIASELFDYTSRSLFFGFLGLAFPSLVFGENGNMSSEHKYARIEWERRFLLDHFPSEANVTRVRRIRDRYIEGTTLRLRQQSEGSNHTVFKLTQKFPEPAIGAQQGLITSMYLTKDEFEVFTKLPAKMLTKTRHSVPPFGIDVFEDTLSGLVLAEAEFNSAAEASLLTLPSFINQEISDDHRFTGGSLVAASRRELQQWLAEYGIRLNPS